MTARDEGGAALTQAAQMALNTCDRFMSGQPITAAERAIFYRVCLAAVYASEAYERGMQRDGATWAMQRSFLQALIDPLHPDLDYLRADPASRDALLAARATPAQPDGEASHD